MQIRIDIAEDLGVEDCTHVVEGATPAGVLDEISAHLDEEHGIDMPEADEITGDLIHKNDYDEETWLLLRRLQEKLRGFGVEIPRENEDGLPSPPIP